MTDSRATCWTLIEGAAQGAASLRDEFAVRYLPVLRSYLGARWGRSSALSQEIDDACQEIVIECMRENGALSRVERGRSGGFRAYLYGVARNVARRFEERRSRNREHPPGSDDVLDGRPADDAPLSKVFDRAWALRLVREAARRQALWAREEGADAAKRVELLILRFQHDLPIRDIALQWNEDPARLHHEYAQARKEFKEALFDVLAFYHPNEPEVARKEGEFLLGLL